MNDESIKSLIKNEYNFDVQYIEKSNESTDGNVYIIQTSNEDSKFVIKIYDDIEHAKSMIKLHTYLNENGLIVPDVIENKEGLLYSTFNYGYCIKYIVCYSFIKGIKLKEIDFNIDKINAVAEYLRKLHRIKVNKFNLKSVPFNIKSDRLSVIHFDITKNNIFIGEDDRICFIDFDDAKWGASVCDVAIAVANLFISKANGLDINGAKAFIDSYYKDNSLLKEKELPMIKETAIKWLNSIINNQNFDTSTRAGLQNKIEQMNKLFG